MSWRVSASWSAAVAEPLDRLGDFVARGQAAQRAVEEILRAHRSRWCFWPECPFTAESRFTWPGSHERSACYVHGPRVRTIARAMGFELEFLPLNAAREGELDSRAATDR